MEPSVHLDPRRLGYFVAVAKELNFRRAARKLHMAQPPLSNQIKRLEEDLGAKLFERPGRRVELTEAGQLLLADAERILGQLRRTQRVVRRAGRGELGQVMLGFTPSACYKVLPPILREFRDSFPEVEVFLHEMKPDQLIDRLGNKWLDVAFFYMPFADENFCHHVVSSEPLVVALPIRHRLAHEPTVRIESLAGEPFILPAQHSRVPGFYGLITELCARAGFSPKAVQKDVWLMQTIVAMVASGIGVSLVPSSMQAQRREGVVYKELRGYEPTVEMAVVWRREDTTPVLSSFLDAVHRTSPRELGTTLRD